MTSRIIKVLRRDAIILLIAVFSIAGIIACGGAEDISGSASAPIELPNADDTGPIEVDDPEIQEPEQPTFDGGTYHRLYVPFTTWREDSGFVTNVSYQDTNTLSNLWRELIEGGKNNDGNRWMIRDGDNHSQGDPRTQNYYYFDRNFDIVHIGNYAGRLRVKQFLGGVIVKYSGGRSPGTWTVGGLYKTLLNKETDNSEGEQGYTKYNNDNLNEFMRGIHDWNEGDLTVILMNVGYDDIHQNEFGVDEYYCTIDDNYRKNPEYFLGKDPKTYLGTDQYNDAKLNTRVNHSWNLWKFNFRFFFGKPYNWQLEDITELNSKSKANLKNYKF